MNVLQVLPELNAGGVERTTLEIVEALNRDGHKAHIVSAGGRMVESILALGAMHHQCPIGSKNILTVPQRIKFLRNIISAHKIDIVHARSRAPAWPAYFAAKAETTPFVTTYHGFYRAKTPVKRFYNAIMTKGACVIANSRFTRDHILQEHGIDVAKIKVIPRGVDMSVFNPDIIAPIDIKNLRNHWGLTVDQKLVLLPGRLTRWKGQILALDALAHLPPDYTLVLLGDAQGRTGYVEEIKAHAKALQLSSRLKIIAHTDNMPLALMCATVVLSASTQPEAFGRVAIEAQAMMRPVVATAHGGTLETVIDGKTGLHARPDSPEQIAKSILQAAAWEGYDGVFVRDRIVTQFSKATLQSATLAVYTRLHDFTLDNPL